MAVPAASRCEPAQAARARCEAVEAPISRRTAPLKKKKHALYPRATPARAGPNAPPAAARTACCGAAAWPRASLPFSPFSPRPSAGGARCWSARAPAQASRSPRARTRAHLVHEEIDGHGAVEARAPGGLVRRPRERECTERARERRQIHPWRPLRALKLRDSRCYPAASSPHARLRPRRFVQGTCLSSRAQHAKKRCRDQSTAGFSARGGAMLGARV